MDKQERKPKGTDPRAPERRKYSRPVLQVFGSVAQLTSSGLFSMGDASQMMMLRPAG